MIFFLAYAVVAVGALYGYPRLEPASFWILFATALFEATGVGLLGNGIRSFQLDSRGDWHVRRAGVWAESKKRYGGRTVQPKGS